MTDTTTISITEAQRDELAALKKHDRESFKAVIGRLLADGTAAADAPAVDAEELADAFGLPDEAIPDDLQGRLDRIGSPADAPAVDADDLADAVAARMGPVELEASERRAIAQEVAEVLR